MIDSLETSSNRHFKLKWKRNELKRLKMNLALLEAEIKKLEAEIRQLQTFSFRRCFGFPDV
jgi:predicted nuclease with TOPRIM domain